MSSNGDPVERDRSLPTDDQTLSDADQTASDSDQDASDTDEAAAEGDQAASDRDQAAADREGSEDESAAEELAHDESREDRAEATRARQDASKTRDETSTKRDEEAHRRDEVARQRDRVADQRDRVADQEDREHEELEEALASDNPDTIAALDAAATLRARGAADRARAAMARARAARDREAAARDRAELRAELHLSGLDELTGAYRRGQGATALANEIERARRSGKGILLAFIDVDGLKSVNDEHGHDEGDALLREVFTALRSKLRAYDPIVRWGGDEFICAISEVGLERARVRLREAGEALDETRPGASISVGLARLGEDDTLESLITRADEALTSARRGR